MQFLYPSFLLALLLLAIPVIIHLFNFRRYKKIVFSDIRFLKQLTEQNKKQQNIKKWLILCCRLLAITFLVFAFAQPFIPFNKVKLNAHNRIVSVFFDNSFSMEAVNKDGPLIEQARNKAKQIAGMYSESDQFQLLTNDFEGRHQRLVSQKDFIQLLGEVQVSPAHRSLGEVYKRQMQMLNADRSAQKNMYWLSDFQKSMSDYSQVQPDSTVTLRLLPIEPLTVQNCWVDSVWLKAPFVKAGSSAELFVLIKNQSDNVVENQPLVLKIDGIEKGIRNYTVGANDKTVVSMNLTLKDFNWHNATLGITDYPLTYDDVYHVAIKAQQSVSVLLLGDAGRNKAFKQVYALDSFYHVNEFNLQQINFGSFQQSSLIILNEPEAVSTGLSQELKKFISGGGVVFFIPSSSPKDAAGINAFLNDAAGAELLQLQNQELKVATIAIQDPLFEKVFAKIPEQANLPSMNSSWQMRMKSSSKADAVVSLNNDWPYLVHARNGKGSIFVASSSFDKSNSNITQHSLFVPILLRMPLLSGISWPLSYTLGEQTRFNFDNPGGLKLVKLKLDKQEHLLEAASREGKWEAHLNGQIKTAGIYSLTGDEAALARIAFNYSRQESYPQTANIDELSTALKATKIDEDLGFLKKKITLEENGTPLWRIALLLALAFVLIELLLLRLLK